jgi:hypothetical protein
MGSRTFVDVFCMWHTAGSNRANTKAWASSTSACACVYIMLFSRMGNGGSNVQHTHWPRKFL